MASDKKNNVLNKQLGSGSKYPTKKSINLLYVEKRAKKNTLDLVVFGVFLLILAVFVKFMVIDKLVEINQKENVYNQELKMLNALQDSNSIYEQVRAEYSHYGNSYLNEDERTMQDRLDVLKVIEDELLEADALANISVTGNVASLIINSDKLRSVSEIVAELESNPIVEYVTVTNSQSDDEYLQQVLQQSVASVETPTINIPGVSEEEELSTEADTEEVIEETTEDLGEAESELETEQVTEQEEVPAMKIITTMTIYFRAATDMDTEANSTNG